MHFNAAKISLPKSLECALAAIETWTNTLVHMLTMDIKKKLLAQIRLRYTTFTAHTD